MAREVDIRIWCDHHLEADEIKVEGEELPPIAIGNQKARVMALCKECRVDFYEPLAEALSRYGVAFDKLATEKPRAVAKKNPGNPNATSPGPRPQVVLPSGWLLPKGISEEKAGMYRVVCPVDGCKELQKSAATMSGHLRDRHDTTLYDAIGPDGTLYDLDGRPVDTPKPRKYTKPHPSKRSA